VLSEKNAGKVWKKLLKEKITRKNKLNPGEKKDENHSTTHLKVTQRHKMNDRDQDKIKKKNE
jgi:hypothetical protein